MPSTETTTVVPTVPSERTQHLQWAKERALEFVDRGDLFQAWSSFLSDMQKHPETAGHVMLPTGMQMVIGGRLNTPADMRRFIEGFG